MEAQNNAYSFEEIKKNPNRLIELLSGSENVSLMIRRRANRVRVLQRAYPDKVHKIIKEAQDELAAEEKAGYDEERSWQDFDAAQKKISDRLKNSKHAEPA